jgi:hypothetical protein
MEESGGSVLLKVGTTSYRVNARNWKAWQSAKSKSSKIEAKHLCLYRRKTKTGALILIERSREIVNEGISWHLPSRVSAVRMSSNDWLSRRSASLTTMSGAYSLKDFRGAHVKKD